MNIKKISIFSILILPIVEIVLFVEIGSIIGSLNTISITILSAFLGIYLIKTHAPTYLAEIRNKLIQGIRPDKEIFSSIITFISGVLFLIPGFLTDFVALLLLFPPIKNTLIRKYSFKPNYSRKQQNRKSVIDVEHREGD